MSANDKPNATAPVQSAGYSTNTASVPDALARAFLDLLKREVGENARSPLPSPDLVDTVDGIFDLLSDPPDAEVEVPLAPDLAGATVMLARAIEEADGLLRDLRRGAPVVVFEVPGAEQVRLVGDALRTCAVGGRTKAHSGDSWSANGSSSGRQLMLFERDGTGTSHSQAKGNGSVAAALRLRMPLIGIASDPSRHLPRDLLRACENWVTLRSLDATGVALVVEAVTGTIPASRLDDDLARIVDLSDLALSIRRDRGADGSLERLAAMLRAKVASGREGPRLEELEGYGAAKEWGLNLAADLRAYREGTLGWAEIDKGILLSGPPGVGKTQFSLALARTCEVPFLAGSLAQWQASRDGHLGHTLAAMRAFFDEARRKAPCIALVDELDSFGDRNSFTHDHKDYSIQIVNGFLECLDGAVAREGVVVVGATNNADRIDPAIRRPGRLDTHVDIPRPDVAALLGILRHHLGPDVLAGVDLGGAAVAARGSTGADCEAWARRAKARARRAGRDPEIEDLLREIRAGAPAMHPDVRRRVSFHEAGHGVAAVVLGIGSNITLGLRSDGGGLTELDDELAGTLTEAALDARLAFVLAGRAAERLAYGDVSAGSGGGPGSDLAAATQLALLAEGRLGFGDDFPLVYFSGRGADIRIDDTPWLAKAVAERLARAFTAATNLLAARRASLIRVAEALVAKGYLDDGEVRALVGAQPRGRRVPPRVPASRP